MKSIQQRQNKIIAMTRWPHPLLGKSIKMVSRASGKRHSTLISSLDKGKFKKNVQDTKV